MNSVRQFSEEEKAVVVALLKAKPDSSHLLHALDGLTVRDMNDGGMGSLSLIPKDSSSDRRSMGKQIAMGEFTDRDGILVSIALNVDNQGKLYELDVWKVNFAPLLHWPDPSAIRIVN